MFEAVRGTSYMSDIAIDDITLSFGLCKQGNIWIIYSIAVFNAENFDNNFCYCSIYIKINHKSIPENVPKLLCLITQCPKVLFRLSSGRQCHTKIVANCSQVGVALAKTNEISAKRDLLCIISHT